MIRSILSSILFVLIAAAATAQTYSPDYYDGAFYVKIADHINPTFSDFESAQVDAVGMEILDVMQDAGVTKFDMPFTRLKTPFFKRVFEIQFDDIAATEQLLEELNALAVLDYAELIPIYKVAYVPNDPNTAQYALPLISAYDAFDLHQGDAGTVVAIIDDAVQLNHQDLQAEIWQNLGEIAGNGIDDDGNGYIDDVFGYDVADNDNDPNPPSNAGAFNFSHGTHCAGIAAADTDNNEGIASIGFDCQIMAIKGATNTSDGQSIQAGYEGVEYAIVNNADVISMSWGGGGSGATGQALFDQAFSQGIICVAAAGNDGTNDVFYPAGADNVVSVANTTSSDAKNGSSNYGSWIDISAPGSGIVSTVYNGNYVQYTGTSMSCPMVAGLVGLMKSYAPSVAPEIIENCLLSSADNIDASNPSYIGQLGSGRINARAALECLNSYVPPVATINVETLGPVCPGSYVQFSDDASYNPTSRTWSFPGGVPSTSNHPNPIIYYPTAGSYNVTLSVTNANGTDMTTEFGVVNINASGRETFFSDNFESGNLTTKGWTVVNPDGSNTWSVAAVGGSNNGDYAAKASLYNYNSTGQEDYLVTPAFDFSGRNNIELEFEHAHRRSTSARSDELRVEVSTNGGSSWTTEFAQNETGTGNFGTGAISNVDFVPGNDADWCYAGSTGASCFTVNLNGYSGQSNVIVRFATNNDNGNNIYLDNIKFSSDCNTVTSSIPNAFFTSNISSTCAPAAIQFTDISQGSPTSWSWSFTGGDIVSSTMQNPVVNYSTPGIYDVTLTATNANGSDSYSQAGYIEIIAPAVPSYSASVVGTTVTFINSSTGASSYYWDFGDGNYSFDASPIHQYAVAGDYTVTLTLTNACGTVNDVQTVSTAPISQFSTGLSGPVCSPATLNLLDNSDGTITSWNWTMTGGSPATSTMQNPSVTYSTPGTYPITLEVTNAFGSNTSTSFVVVTEFPQPSFTYSQSGANVNFTNTTVGTGSTYSWDFGDGNTSTSALPNHTYAGPGTYTVTLTASNSCGTDTYSEVITITGVNVNAAAQTIEGFISPTITSTTTQLFISESLSDSRVLVFDVLGQQVDFLQLNDVLAQSTHQINLSSFVDGVYIIRLESNEGASTYQVIKQ